MTEHIDRQAALEAITKSYGDIAEAEDNVRALPTADVIEVVRCKDCKHRPVEKGEYWRLEFPDEVCPCQEIDADWYGRKPADDWFCANGKRNGDDSEAN